MVLLEMLSKSRLVNPRVRGWILFLVLLCPALLAFASHQLFCLVRDKIPMAEAVPHSLFAEYGSRCAMSAESALEGLPVFCHLYHI